MSLRLLMMLLEDEGGAVFTPVTRVYGVGSGTELAPAGATTMRARVQAGGGFGGTGNFDDTVGAGAPGGGARELTIAVVGGNSFTYIVGSNNQNSSLSGSVSGGSVTLSAAANGGTGSGAGTGYAGGAGGPFGVGNGGLGAGEDNFWAGFATFGAGGNGGIFGGEAGNAGRIEFYYT